MLFHVGLLSQELAPLSVASRVYISSKLHLKVQVGLKSSHVRIGIPTPVLIAVSNACPNAFDGFRVGGQSLGIPLSDLDEPLQPYRNKAKVFQLYCQYDFLGSFPTTHYFKMLDKITTYLNASLN